MMPTPLLFLTKYSLCGTSLVPRGFSSGTRVAPGTPAFPNSNSTRNSGRRRTTVDVLPSNRYLFIYVGRGKTKPVEAICNII